MSRQYQDPRYQSPDDPYQTSSNVPRQYEQSIPPFPTAQDAYPSHSASVPPSQHAYTIPTHLEGRQQPQSSTHSGGYLPYAEGHVPFPEPSFRESSSFQRSSTGHPSIYIPPTMPQSTGGPYQQDRQDPYGYPPSGGSPSSSHHDRAYPATSSVTSSTDLYARSEVQTHPGSGYTITNTRPQDRNATEYEEEQYSPDFRPKGPGNSPVATHRHVTTGRICRLRYCGNPVFHDPRVNEFREWCSDEHMRAGIETGIEKPCRECRIWPRRHNYRFCSGDTCRYPGIPAGGGGPGRPPYLHYGA
jgi:hypothetical protein